MAKFTRIDPRALTLPSFQGRYMVDTFRGQVRLRAWPRKRGKSKSEAVLAQQDWFAQARRAIKFIDGRTMNTAIQGAKGSGLYPADIIMSALRFGLFDIEFTDGSIATVPPQKLERIVFQGARVDRDSPQGLSSGGWRVITWTQPVLQNPVMWTVGAPDWLVVPENVTVIAFSFTFRTTTGALGFMFAQIEREDGVVVAQGGFENGGGKGGTIATGPLNVIAGQRYRCRLFPESNQTLDGTPATSFTAVILGTL